MRDDADFAAYLAARWTMVVCSLMLMGSSQHRAEELARTGLARCCSVWPRVRKADDVDVYVYREVMTSWHTSRRHRWWGEPPAELFAEPAANDDPAGPTDAALLRQALVDQLRALDAEDREPLVLRYVAELSEPQVADVLEAPVDAVWDRVARALGGIDPRALGDRVPAGVLSEPLAEPLSGPLAEEIFRTASESIDVLPPTIDVVAARSRELRLRRWRVVAASVLAIVLVLSGLTWLATRASEEPQATPPEVIRSPNPVDVAWYGNGRLHLADIAIALPPITELAQISGGAVYGDRLGNVNFAASDGVVTLIGRKVTGTPLVTSDDVGWAAWVDPRGEVPQLVVYDIDAGAVLASLDVSASGTEPIAIDQGRVFYRTPSGDWAWTPPSGEPTRLERTGLLDAGAALTVYQAGSKIEIVQPFFNVSYLRRGEGARVSPGGSYVLSRRPGAWTPGEPFRPLLYDARSGARFPSGIGPGLVAIDAGFGINHGVVYLATRVADLHSGADLGGNVAPLVILRACEPRGECHDVAPLPGSAARPVLAH
jgi:DNA-directed RNA polymerase specialized sigma24 family protein